MLKVNNLTKCFTMHIRGGVEIPSFSNVSFQVKEGQLLAITGPSGIGKSSLLKCIYRTYIPTRGEVLYTTKAGKTINLSAAGDREIIRLRHEEMGYVSQFFHVLPRVPAKDILISPLLERGVPKKEASDRVCELLLYAGLGETLWNMYPSTFSGGEKQRLNILYAIITKPRFLLLDEPTASLDRGYKSKIMELILQLKKEGTAMLGVFHDQDALSVLSDLRYDLIRGEYCQVTEENVYDTGRSSYPQLVV